MVKLKKFVASALAFMFIFSLLFTDKTYANYQNHVSSLTISDATVQGKYAVTLKWVVPPASTQADLSAKDDPLTSIHEGEVIHGTAGYHISQRNVTEMTPAVPVPSEQLVGSADNFTTDLLYPKDGSLYLYGVTPYHQHEYEQRNQNGVIVDVYRDAPYTQTYPTAQALYMTDIKVEAKGQGTELTVTWDNPKFSGQSIFPAYRIFYQKGGSNVSEFNEHVNVSVEDCVQVPDPDRPGVFKLQYTIVDNKLTQGTTYAVKVEPLQDKNIMIRSLPPSQRKVTVNNTEYPISMREISPNGEYRTNEASIDLHLDVEEYGKDYLNLLWGLVNPTSGTVISLDVRSSTRAEDLTKESDGKIVGGTLLYSFSNAGATSTITARVARPDVVTYYRVIAYTDTKVRIVSNIAVYDPYMVDIVPNSPEIYATEKPTQNAFKKTIDVIWKAFLRSPMNILEEAAAVRGVYNDKEVVYDLYITDILSNFDNTDFPPAFINAPSGSFASDTTPDGDIAYLSNLSQYVKYENHAYDKVDITTNKTYFIKMYAKKPVTLPDGTVIYRQSQPSIVAITINAQGDISTPPVIGKPPLKIIEEGITYLDVQWKNSWYEIYDAANESWHSAVAVNAAQQLVYGELEILNQGLKPVEFSVLATQQAVREAFAAAGYTGDFILRNLALNTVNLDSPEDKAKYEMKIMPYDGVVKLSEWLNPKSAGYTANWIPISVNYSEFMNYKFNGLIPNTTYVVLLRAYREVGDQKFYGDPNFVIGTTLTEITEIDIDPVVPYLEGYAETDTSVTVIWARVSGLKYELIYSPTYYDEATGTSILWNEISENGKIVKGSDIGKTGQLADTEYYMYEIKGLFPNKDYYFWVKSTGRSGGAEKSSDWSNMVLRTTKDMEAPLPPDGLGLASKDFVAQYNELNGTDYRNNSKDYMIIEWLRDPNDTVPGLTGSASGLGGAGIEAVPEMIPLESALISYLVRFSGLTPNTHYFYRAKTILTATMGANGVEKSYTYLVQIAKDIYFTDYVEVYIPNARPEKATGDFLQKESDFCDVIVLATKTSDDEYDSGVNPDTVPLPTSDFEIIYNKSTKTLDFRFRSNKKDADGNWDNNVDQRFISKLVRDKVFIYDVDLSTYGAEKITFRNLTLPYSIYKAFEERQINLAVKAGNISVTLSPGALNTNELVGRKDFGKESLITISFAEQSNGFPSVYGTDIYASSPQKVSVSVQTPTGTVNVKDIAKPVKVDMRLINRYVVLDRNVAAYYSDANTAAWTRVDSVYESVNAVLNFSTKSLGNFASIAKSAPKASDNTESNDAYTINSKINITDMPKYDPNSLVSAMQLNKIMSAVATNAKEVRINEAITDAESYSLDKAGLFITGTAVTRETAINSLVKLYELKTKGQVKAYPSASESSFTDIGSVSANYQTAVLKAEKIGLAQGNTIRAKDNMKLSELLSMIAIIIEDSNL